MNKFIALSIIGVATALVGCKKNEAHWPAPAATPSLGLTDQLVDHRFEIEKMLAFAEESSKNQNQFNAQQLSNLDPLINKSSSVSSKSIFSENRTRLVETGGTFKVPAKINDQINLNFIVDSGAADVNVPADVVLTLIRTGTILESDFKGIQTYQLADGRKVQSRTFILRSVQVGNHTVQNVLASVTDVDGKLLLGQTFLKRIKSWSIDNSTKELVLN